MNNIEKFVVNTANGFTATDNVLTGYSGPSM